MFKKLLTAAWMVLMLACCQFAAAATTVTVSATPSNPTAPANVTLAVTATSDSGPVMATQVEYFSGATSLGIALQAPFTLAVNDLAAGTYQITAKVTTTDPDNPMVQSPPLALTVGTAPGAATAYFIHTDQLNTPRVITNSNGAPVWQWDSDPFGKEPANEQPAGRPVFTHNPRFPGQQFDRESNLHFNYYRDYDPKLGRYVQSDPTGLAGGINTYGYVGGNPLTTVDPNGLDGISLMADRAAGIPYGKPGDAYSTTFTVTSRGVCDGSKDPMCAAGMKAAGIEGPYFGTTKTYDAACMLGIGVGVKGGGAIAGNAAANQVPKIAAKAGASARALSLIGRGVGIFTSPITAAVSLASALGPLYEHCEVKPPVCEANK